MHFDADQRAVLGRLADVLIPAADGFPSASQAGVAGARLDEALSFRPDLAALLKKIVALTSDLVPAKAVAHLEACHPELFGALTDFVPGAYFLNPDVRVRLSYRGQVPHPIPPISDEHDSELQRTVMDRGPIYRPTPPGGPPCQPTPRDHRP